MVGAFGDHGIQVLLGLEFVAQEIGLGGAGDGLTLRLGQGHESITVRLVGGFKLLETLVAGDDEEVVLAAQQLGQFVFSLQRILSIVFQLLTFLTKSFLEIIHGKYSTNDCAFPVRN